MFTAASGGGGGVPRRWSREKVVCVGDLNKIVTMWYALAI